MFPAAQTYQKALYDAGIPATALSVDNMEGLYQELSHKGVQFQKEPQQQGNSSIVVFDDQCGNWIQIYTREVD